MKYTATEKFKTLGIENSYQGLRTEDYFDFLYGKQVEIDNPPKHLIEGKFIEKVLKVKKEGD